MPFTPLTGFDPCAKELYVIPKEMAPFMQHMTSALDYKYHDADSARFVSGGAQWRACARVQTALMQGRKWLGQASDDNVREIQEAEVNFRPDYANSLEGTLKHDQLAVLEELRQYMSQDTFDKMHPGTTSY